jgi:hypothetical protein
MADAKSRAAEYVDAAHHRAHAGLKASHAKWERHELNHQLGRINSIKENRATIDARYVQRVQTIQNKKANMAVIIDRQHKSLGGRLEALTPKGRARQAETWRRLDERAGYLEWRAGIRHQQKLEQHHGHVQEARMTAARSVKGLRGQHRDDLHTHKQQHLERRPNKIHTRMREMEQAKIVQLRPALKHEHTRQANKPPSQTIQHKR